VTSEIQLAVNLFEGLSDSGPGDISYSFIETFSGSLVANALENDPNYG
jgi:hypothetical protein